MGRRGRRKEYMQTLTTQILVLSLCCCVTTITTHDWEVLEIIQSFKIENSGALKSEELVKSRLQFALLKKFSSLLVYTSPKRQINILTVVIKAKTIDK